jgi:hypothetical protein
MSNVNLICARFSDNTKQTLSYLSVIETVDNKEFNLFDCASMELPWKNNERGVSCIPLGDYDCEKIGATAAIPYEHIAILNVQGRSGVCIHKANFTSQLRGCIAVGDKHVDINHDNQLDVTNSGKTFNVLMSLLPNKFKLKII